MSYHLFVRRSNVPNVIEIYDEDEIGMGGYRGMYKTIGEARKFAEQLYRVICLDTTAWAEIVLLHKGKLELVWKGKADYTHEWKWKFISLAGEDGD